MANLKNMEMAKALSNHQHISIRKSMLGLRTSVVYEPSQSPVVLEVRDFAPDEGQRLEKLLRLPLDKLASELSAKGKPKDTPVGQYRLESAVSKDGQLVALQLFRFTDFSYNPVTEPLFFEGKDAQTARLLAE